MAAGRSSAATETDGNGRVRRHVLSGRPGYFVGGAGSAGTVSCFGGRALVSAGTGAHTIIGTAENPFEIFRTALRAFHLEVFFLIHHEQFKTRLTFQAFKFEDGHG
jgi:hypothetical protein